MTAVLYGFDCLISNTCHNRLICIVDKLLKCLHVFVFLVFLANHQLLREMILSELETTDWNMSSQQPKTEYEECRSKSLVNKEQFYKDLISYKERQYESCFITRLCRSVHNSNRQKFLCGYSRKRTTNNSRRRIVSD